MSTLPLFLEMNDVPVLLVGSGPIARRKLKPLAAAGARVTHLERFDPARIDRRFRLAIAASDPGTNARVAAWGREHGIWVNAVDDPEHCTALWPAVVDRSPVKVAIGTDGTAPVLARRIRALLEQLLPERLGAVAAIAGRLRDAVSRTLPTAARRPFWERLFAELPDDPGTFELAARQALDNPSPAPVGRVDLVGAGPGDPELLTLQAARSLQTADVIVFDRLVDPRILQRARRDAEFIAVGKMPGGPCTPQPEINRIVVEHARRGRQVCRLKGGDPTIFGRLGEELAALHAAAVPARILPGITAAVGAAAGAGLSLTHRDHAHALVLATAHGVDERAFEELAALAGPRRTLAVYMGVARLAALREALLDRGLPADLPVCMVENASRREERRVTTSLDQMVTAAARARLRSPAMLLIGKVAAEARPTVSGSACASTSIEPRLAPAC